MRKKIFQWLGREFVALSTEGKAGTTAGDEARDIFRRLDEELRGMGLGLENTVRTRLWGIDRESRNSGSDVRFEVLSGKARSVSSSYIAPEHFESDARVALDLLAMRPVRADLEKALKEYSPPAIPLRYLIYDSIVFLSGVTAVLPTLADQVANILPRISGSLSDAGTSWERVAKISFFLHRSQKPENLNELFAKTVKADVREKEYVFVDGYSAEGKLVEVEVTAAMPPSVSSR
jgi:enamine deaminase RidA (YjgF/YER057c/UK114 family)